MRTSSRPWLWATTALFVIFSLLLVAALVAPTWIESVLGFSPDAGTGEAEWGLATAFGVVAVASGLFAGRQWRRVWVSSRA
ncbi:MAG: hypothetical protein IPJ14_05055 [Kineosporiaceae bacterium]|nr:hypothetical protein [Kineosporiaceae bacterium]MBK7622028.1 hypothetical protein [Kineosporiaceae bacterium]MBK8074340.1 hypothetical protein [Kineosporiaceae bacterium]